MRILVFFTKKCNILYEKYFSKSVSKYNEHIIEDMSIKSLKDEEYNSKDWIMLMKYKIEIILNEILKNTGEIFMYNDVDIQYLGKTESIILKSMKNKDIVFQQNDKGSPNAGIIVCRSSIENKNAINFLRKVIEILDFNYNNIESFKNVEYSTLSDNSTIYKLLEEKFPINWGLLPKEFITGKLPSLKKVPNHKILLHHASCVSKISEKIDQLEWVKEIVQK